MVVIIYLSKLTVVIRLIPIQSLCINSDSRMYIRIGWKKWDWITTNNYSVMRGLISKKSRTDFGRTEGVNLNNVTLFI